MPRGANTLPAKGKKVGGRRIPAKRAPKRAVRAVRAVQAVRAVRASVPKPKRGPRIHKLQLQCIGQDGQDDQDDQDSEDVWEALIPHIPCGTAPVWAKTRAALSDGTPYFRLVQGSNYHNVRTTNGCTIGLLLNDAHRDRVYCDEEVIITRVSGGYKSGPKGLKLAKHHDFSMVPAKNLKKSMDERVPVAVIVGTKSGLLALDLPPNHNFSVMAWFLVTDIWFEEINGYEGLKVRLEKLDLSEKSWWGKEGSADPIPHSERDFDLQPTIKTCGGCSQPTAQIFNEGWMCLRPECDNFWEMEGMEGYPAPKKLTYHADFLQKRQPPTGIVPPPLVPDFFGMLAQDSTIGGIKRINWRGPVCPNCQQCLSRVQWNGWCCDCENGLKRIVDVDPIVTQTSPGHEDNHGFGSDVMPRGSTVTGFVKPPPNGKDSYRHAVYTVPDGAGTIVHFFANSAMNELPDGADESLGELKHLACTELNLKRYPLSNAVVDGTLTCHFAQNFGEPYKYVVDVDSVPFSSAPERIRKLISLLTWATQEASETDGSDGASFHAPNELLLLGYFEEMEIGYHDDGEAGLGPTITTLSLGGPSRMFIRMKGKYYNGFSKQARAPLREDPVPSGCLFETDRRRLKTEFEAGKISSATYVEERKKLFGGARYQEPVDALVMRLEHGDVVVMHGVNLQKYYEHSVRPFEGYGLRFAATARHIQEF